MQGTIDPEAVISAAKHQIISSNYAQVEEARATVFATLEKCAHDEAVSIPLYLRFADLEIELRQFKQATKVFEQAVVAWSSSLQLWERYVSFCLDRQKYSNAKKIVVRANEILPAPCHTALWTLLEENENTKADVPALKAQLEAGSTITAVAPAPAPIPTPSPTPSIEPVELKSTVYFQKLPTTLPVTPDCPYLLFDPVDPAITLPTPVLYQINEHSRNEMLFREVLRLWEIQRQKEVDTLYRWQDLIAMQMKEGSELYKRVYSSEASSDPKIAIEQQTEQLTLRHEFASRAATSQAQFIEITAMDRGSQLANQQRTLQALNVPLMTVTKDPLIVAQQRKVVALVLEAEAAYRKQQQQRPPAHRYVSFHRHDGMTAVVLGKPTTAVHALGRSLVGLKIFIHTEALHAAVAVEEVVVDRSTRDPVETIMKTIFQVGSSSLLLLMTEARLG
ncbi:hypothetical protein Ae201684_015987 [Aphanomyces euteiches]|uniref:Suppressor of forked domain-containing protein n=1 Tax=Aphanomyces euteiches TaxID=100861 RepID=A0A6G0WE66_9STRA|nr:hypothetical protein Ae201684_015987 [Aphanomyces euteiches]